MKPLFLRGVGWPVMIMIPGGMLGWGVGWPVMIMIPVFPDS